MGDGAAGRTGTETETLGVSVHGPAGVLDLVVPAGARAADVAREYAAQSRLGTIPLLHRGSGVLLPADSPLVSAGVRSGEVLVAVTEVHRPRSGPAPRVREHDDTVGAPVRVLAVLAAGLALLAGYVAGQAAVVAGDGGEAARTAVVVLLAVLAVAAVLPLGPGRRARVLVAPAFGGAAALAASWSPGAERLPMVLGVAALAAALVAALARALVGRDDQELTVWLVVGTATFALAGLAAVADRPPQVFWAVALALAALGARFVPSVAVDVPDHVLLDLERLAVNAWSARDRTTGGRGRVLVRREAVSDLVRQGGRLVTASAAAVLVVVAVAAPALVRVGTTDVDRHGVRVLLLVVGATLLLTGRHHRHVGARRMLRAAGTLAWLVLAVALADQDWARDAVLLLGVPLALVLVGVGVGVGRGWRSVWWSRRAEVAEGLCAAAVLPALLVAAGLFRAIWESSPVG